MNGKTPEFDPRDGIPRSIIMNGAGGISQRHGAGFINTDNIGIGTGTASRNLFDRWHLGGGSVFSTGQFHGSDPIGGPGLALSGRALGKIQRYEVDTAEGAPAASQAKFIQQWVEGETLRNNSVAGKPLLVCLWMNATPGYTLTLGHATTTDGTTPTHSYLTPITTVSGWTKYPFILPPHALAPIHEGNGRGLSINLSFHTGSDLQSSTANEWQSGVFVKLAGESNFMDTIGNFIELDQIMMVPGVTDTSLAFVPHSYEAGGELRAMQRFFQKSWNLDVAVGTNTGIGNDTGLIRQSGTFASSAISGAGVSIVTKRGLPVVVFYDDNGAANSVTQQTSTGSVNAAQSINQQQSSVNHIFVRTNNGVSSAETLFHYTADAEL